MWRVCAGARFNFIQREQGSVLLNDLQAYLAMSPTNFVPLFLHEGGGLAARSHRILHPTCMKRGASRLVCQKECFQGDFMHFLKENALFAKAR